MNILFGSNCSFGTTVPGRLTTAHTLEVPLHELPITETHFYTRIMIANYGMESIPGQFYKFNFCNHLPCTQHPGGAGNGGNGTGGNGTGFTGYPGPYGSGNGGQTGGYTGGPVYGGGYGGGHGAGGNGYQSSSNNTLTTTNISLLPLHYACLQGNLVEVKRLIEETNQDPYEQDPSGCSCLIYAVWGKHVEVVKYLMEAVPGIHLDATNNETTCLHIVCAVGDTTMFDEILAPVLKYLKYNLSGIKNDSLAQETLELLVRNLPSFSYH